MDLNVKLVSLLACPVCRGGLETAGEDEGLLCPACSLVYPVKSGIPVMLAEEAVSLAEWRKGKREAAIGKQDAKTGR